MQLDGTGSKSTLETCSRAPQESELAVVSGMAASLLQPAGTPLAMLQSAASLGSSHQRGFTFQHLFPGDSNLVSGSSSFPAIAGGLRRFGPGEISWSEELLWRQFFLDPALWWDNRHDKKNSRSPDFRHRESKEVLRLNSSHKPAWVDVQLATLDAQTVSSSNSRLLNEPGRDFRAGAVSRLCEKGQLSECVDTLALLVQAESPVPVSLVYSVLKRCVAQKELALGQRVHDLVVQMGYESNTFLSNHILRMYASQGRLQEARDVFTRVPEPDAFMWSSIISGHARNGQVKQAIELYHQMRSSNVRPDGHVFVAALQACATAADLESGRQVHSDVLRTGVPSDKFLWSCLVDMYAKCGSLEDARSIFDGLPTRDVVTWTAMIAGYAKCGRLADARELFDTLESTDVVTWNAMIAGYAEHGLGQEALALYTRMEQEGVVVANSVTFAFLLKACATSGALQQGKQLHAQIRERGLEANIFVGTCLVDMYAKCGRLDEAHRIFYGLPTKDVVTWNAMINGLGQSNEGYKAIDCFQEMVRDGVQPDQSTLTGLLVACSHEGLVEEGKQIFKAMVEEHDVVPTIEHYNCMVDLLGRSGHLDEAEKMLSSFESDDVGYTSLLNACRTHGDIERAMRCFEQLVRLDPENAGTYVHMGTMFADAGRWSDVERIERLRKSVGANKKPASAGIEVDKRVHTFVVGDERGEISSKVRTMNTRLKDEGGHLPRTELVLKTLSEKEKENDLCGHAEKLALAYGLLNTPDGTPLLVTKNLRMCGDCHSSTEIMSRVEKREIVVRDAHRVHRFVDGSCLCGGRP